MLENLLNLIILIIPAYVANASPVILGGGQPMDFGAKFYDKKRILGDGKTWRGFFGGVASGTLAGVLLSLVFPWLTFEASFLLSVGALVGDSCGSFVKRRMGTEQGKPSFALDQLTFLFFALAFAFPFISIPIDIYSFVFLVILTYCLHLVANIFAHKMGWKKVPW